ncbi:hypothetical protein [Rhodobacter capsulatus]|jgi:hypothetical protein|uniref:Membrane protein, putative n=1 Tax=Rhodobacter capsulatus (strain ATCC BAA-309 / NBRC 16581 / SB1003) TaxID=272942 RepID=D5AUQ6_RHOCB|nr:hypothetical protein [Rhodobacter capsulatus]ADE85695.1 membrane protein, putative [Rhodobacter capsulatus SB 1003]ETD01861.1 hypothetical protein U714_11080 [Rhodobacter capsulatus DE442]ETD76477.1 hypothetical protein U716_17415 [Rhodobacter capsulatus B6]ETD76918.1 hypothetical protein U717_11235 [Rhodobacter capsulatus R121]ETE53754.1 hypothetical protein U715_11240 [Rhodobacter capsulatus Y262]
MKSAVVLALLGSLALTAPALAQSAPKTEKDETKPAVVLPEGDLPVGRATNLVFLLPLLGGVAGLAALSAGGGGGSSTPSTN